MAKLLTESELSALIQAAVNAERSACAHSCILLGERTRTMRERAVALACFAAILERGMPSSRIDAAVSKPDTPAHETPKPD